VEAAESNRYELLFELTRDFRLPESLHSWHDFLNRSRIILEPLHSRIMDSRLRNVPVTVLRDPLIANGNTPGIFRIAYRSYRSIRLSLGFRSKDWFL